MSYNGKRQQRNSSWSTLDSNGNPADTSMTSKNKFRPVELKRPIPCKPTDNSIWNVKSYLTKTPAQPQTNNINPMLGQNMASMSMNLFSTLKYLQSMKMINDLQKCSEMVNLTDYSKFNDKHKDEEIKKSEFKPKATKIYDKFTLDDIEKIELSDEDMDSDMNSDNSEIVDDTSNQIKPDIAEFESKVIENSDKNIIQTPDEKLSSLNQNV